MLVWFIHFSSAINVCVDLVQVSEVVFSMLVNIINKLK